jgi:hypothetical protein
MCGSSGVGGIVSCGGSSSGAGSGSAASCGGGASSAARATAALLTSRDEIHRRRCPFLQVGSPRIDLPRPLTSQDQTDTPRSVLGVPVVIAENPTKFGISPGRGDLSVAPLWTRASPPIAPSAAVTPISARFSASTTATPTRQTRRIRLAAATPGAAAPARPHALTGSCRHVDPR